MEKFNKKINLAFISNTRCSQEALILTSNYPAETNPVTGEIEFFICKKVTIELNGITYTSQMLLIPSTADDLYKGLCIKDNLSSKDKVTAMNNITKGREQVKAAVLYAANELDVDVVCFGAATKRLLKPNVLRNLPLNKNITFSLGDNYTAAVCIAQIKEAATVHHINLNDENTNFVIAGAYGLIGQLVTSYFASYRCRLILVGRDISRFKTLVSTLPHSARYQIYSDLKDIRCNVDILFASTNAPNSIINSELISNWGDKIIALDVAEPANISPEVCQECSDVLTRYDAGIVFNETLSFENGNGMNLRERTIFACFAEGIISSVMIYRKEFNLGQFDLMNVNASFFDMLNNFAEKCGFCIDQLQSFGIPVTLKAA